MRGCKHILYLTTAPGAAALRRGPYFCCGMPVRGLALYWRKPYRAEIRLPPVGGSWQRRQALTDEGCRRLTREPPAAPHSAASRPPFPQGGRLRLSKKAYFESIALGGHAPTRAIPIEQKISFESPLGMKTIFFATGCVQERGAGGLAKRSAASEAEPLF